MTGLTLLGAVFTPILGGKRWDRSIWARSAGVVVVGLGYLFINPRGGPNPFPFMIGATAFAVVLLGLVLAITLSWRWAHRERHTATDRQAAVNFSGVVIFAFFAVACLAGTVICSVGTVEGLAVRSAYEHAPSCGTEPTSLCRSQTDGQVIRT